MSATSISADDLRLLKESAEPASRAAIARKLAGHLQDAETTSTEYRLAYDIALFLQRDRDMQVRVSLANALKNLQSAPLPLLRMLAEDECDEVAIPVLRYSPALTNTVLLSLINGTEQTMRLIAIAERPVVSLLISEALLEKQQEMVSLALLQNEHSELNDTLYDRLATIHPSHKALLLALSERLPQPKAAMAKMAEAIRGSVAQKQDNAQFSIRSFTLIANDGLERDIGVLLELGMNPNESAINTLVQEQNRLGNLNANFMLLSLCLGYRSFFIACMQQHSHLAKDEVERLCAGSEEDFRVLFNKSRLSSSLFGLLFWALTGMRDNLYFHKPGTRRMAIAMAEHLVAAEASVNFAGTIGRPVASALLRHF